jgi:hypothetical protein
MTEFILWFLVGAGVRAVVDSFFPEWSGIFQFALTIAILIPLISWYYEKVKKSNSDNLYF